jgi:alanine racemase
VGASAVRPTRATIDTAALGHNLSEVRRLVGTIPVLGIVKADAYGHGARLVGRALEAHGIDWMGVALVEEGLELREVGVGTPLLVLDGSYGDAYPTLLRQHLTPVVFRIDHLEGLAAASAALGLPAEAHLKVDTGMGRLGVLPQDAMAFALAAKMKGVALTGLCTHFANADLGDGKLTRAQMQTFAEVLARVRDVGHDPKWIHLANSAASIELASAHGTLVRPGLMLYGHVPAARLSAGLDLRPVLRWTTEIVQLKQVPIGFPVSYGGRFVTARPSRLATLAVGYADGFRRGLSGQAEVLIRGSRVPVVGVITMDLCVADVTDLPEVAVGDEVVLLGRQAEQVIEAEELARRCGTISYEILCGIGARVPRIAKSGS